MGQHLGRDVLRLMPQKIPENAFPSISYLLTTNQIIRNGGARLRKAARMGPDVLASELSLARN